MSTLTAPNPDRPAVRSGYAPINGLEMYYEVRGSGRPLILLHGGLSTIGTSFGKVIDQLAGHREVIAIEQQAHGRTADIDRPLDFDRMADDTAALLRHLGLHSVDFFGYSDGGILALGLAIRHPHLVRSLVLLGTIFHNDGLPPGFVDMVRHSRAEDMPAVLRDAYTEVAPRPDDFPVLVAKCMDLWVNFAGWRPEDLRVITAPTLIMIGDSDLVQPEHAVALYRLLPEAQLAILPGADHFTPLERPEWILPMIQTFLAANR